ncbi:GNAT family N-acetyltransferase [Paenalkalicoccus suaedae]|uniref:GNAT family N-acetyltransferase n=1 Tax=Paenalkalicoccus suaedae TaxID=2592382 RepID=A0A859FJB0_9BACI|nr:GNAT family N-acetyltransferase [Paenalkalicoccus suaedae]QKS72786.1 GNAT family N-acetyltransferase [Paenalkalicoccus suaedae]
MQNIDITVFSEDERDIEELTVVLNRAYKQLADMGMRYVASHQNSTITRERIAQARCLVALDGERIVGTISFYPPGTKVSCPWYSKSDVAVIGQFGVLPEYQGSGVGKRLLDAIEQYAREQDHMHHVALDTAETADHLIALYTKRGYGFVEYVDWEATNYRSVIMSKPLR